MWRAHRLYYSCIQLALQLLLSIALLFWLISQSQIFTAQRSDVRVCLCVFVCVRLCLFEKYWKADCKLRQGRIADINQLHSPSFLGYSVKCRCVFVMAPWFHLSWVQVRERSVPQSRGTSAHLPPGLASNTPLLSSNSSIGLNWANPCSKECLKFTNCGPCLTKNQVN